MTAGLVYEKQIPFSPPAFSRQVYHRLVYLLYCSRQRIGYAHCERSARAAKAESNRLLVYENKVDATKVQYARMEEAIRVGQFVRNKCLRLWMDGIGVSANDLQVYCSQLAKESRLLPASILRLANPPPTEPGSQSIASTKFAAK